MRKRHVMRTLLAAATALALTACGSGSGSSSSGSSSQTEASSVSASSESTAAVSVSAGASVSQDADVTAMVAVDFTTMDPMDTSDTLSGGVQRMMMDGLFGFDEDMQIIPMLATDYEANDEATEYTIYLRQGISFTDGTPWDADALIANVNKWADKSLGLKRTTFLCNTLDHAEKIDDYTVKIYLVEPFGAFISNLAHPATLIMSPKQIEAGVDACAQAPVGTGQYKFVEWVAGDHTTLELNKDWWGYDAEICGGTALADADAGFKTITFKPVSESATRVAAVQSGDAQIMWSVPTESVETLQADSNVSVNLGDSITVWYFFMNNQKEPFNDVRVRQAMAYAINKEAYIQVVMNGYGSPATSMVGEAVQHYKGNDPYPYDPEKAKELLAEAGYPDGFTTTLMYSNTTTNQKKAEFYKQQLAEVGINLELNGMESAVLNEKVQGANVPGAEAEVECYLSGWSTSTGDADWGLRPMLAIESEPPMSYNLSYYENEKVDQLLKDGLATANEEERDKIYAEVQDIVWEEVPLVCVSNDKNIWATSSNITGVYLLGDGSIGMRNAKMAAE
ncbi:MAG: glutathione ABC transporter substrate-binding protein [Fusicatenibacter sp.]|nr:glutathione ABC transporter substrate-binding protein [Lachnospiraceae bacterium]MDY2937979.1 glutathione ABC transporter substrate-binding protein [Fusicatenibacter sp.]